MKPTSEQEAILAATGRVVGINARAGTGKSTTLQMVSDLHPDQRILYLVFNKRAEVEARKRFSGHVEVRTIHALAYRNQIRVQRDWQVDRDHGMTPGGMLPYFTGMEEPQKLATVAAEFLQFFLNSPAQSPEEAAAQFKEDRVSGDAKDQLGDHLEMVVAKCRMLMRGWHRGERPCPHDYYLKLYHHSREFQHELEGFDIVLVDEAQDLSPIMVDALQGCTRRLFVVGDSHQQIYSFRNAVDAMTKVKADETFDLTQSFRFGPSIAETATTFIRDLKGEAAFVILGTPSVASRVSVAPRRPRVHDPAGVGMLSRTNLSLFGTAMLLRRQGLPFRFESDVRAVLFRVLDIYWLAHGSRHQIRDPFIKSFPDMASVESYAEEMQDFQLNQTCKIVREHDTELPKAAFEFLRMCAEPDGGGVEKAVLSTIHSAKGREYSRVILDADVPLLLNKAIEAEDATEVAEEANVAYVGITRAQHDLVLPQEMDALPGGAWGELVAGLPEVTRLGGQARETPSRTPWLEEESERQKPSRIEEKKRKRQDRQDRRGQDREGEEESKREKPSQKKKRKRKRQSRQDRRGQDREGAVRWETGQSVVTPRGPGTLVELTGRQGLVRQADGVTQWLELRSIKPPR